MDDMENLLSSGSLCGEDRTRREDLEGGRDSVSKLAVCLIVNKQRREEFVVTMEPMDCTVEGTGVAGRPGWDEALLGAGLTVVLVVEAERGLLSDRSTGSV